MSNRNPPELVLMTARVGDGMKGLVYSEEPGVDFFSWFINPMTGDPHHLDGHEYVTEMMKEKGLDSWPTPLYTLAYLDNNIDVVIMGEQRGTRFYVKDVMSHLDVKGNPWVSVWRGCSGVWRGTVADFRTQTELPLPLSRSTAQNPGKGRERDVPAKANIIDGPLAPGMKGQAYLTGDKIEIRSWFVNNAGWPHHYMGIKKTKPFAFLAFIGGGEYQGNKTIGCYLNPSHYSVTRDPYDKYVASIIEHGFTGKRGDDDVQIGWVGMSLLLSTTVREYLRKVYGVDK
jgi:hypothetical protein